MTTFKRYTSSIGLVILVFTMTSCSGGGGGGLDTSPSGYSLWINDPTSNENYQTDNPTLDLKGSSFVPDGAICTGIVGTMPSGYQVAWTNSVNGVSGSGIFYLGCLLQVNVIWTAYSIPLVLGINTITVTATDSAGNTASDTIQVNRVADTTPPTIISTAPDNGDTGIWLYATVVVTFSEDMDTTTINSTTFRLMDGLGNPISGFVYYDATQQQASITPQLALAYGTTYTATITTGAKDAVGNGLMGDYSFSFTTTANP